MIPAFLLGPLLVILLACLLDNVDGARRPLARSALALATISATVLMADYYVQFTTVQASLVRGETGEGLSLLSQYNPHGVFVAFEDIGYFAMLSALAMSAAAMGADTRAERILRRVLATAGTHGRTTSRMRRTPVLVTSLETERYLVALAGQSQWVPNVRAATGRAWLRRRGRTAVTLEEVPACDRAPILLAYLQHPARDGTRQVDAGQARHYFGVGPDPVLADLAAVAGYYPVFRIRPLSGPDPEPLP